MEEKTQNRYGNLDGLKVVAAFGIVAMHVSSNMDHPLSSAMLTNIIASMTHFVKLFLVLSGFGMCCGYYDKFKVGDYNLDTFYLRRFSKNFPFFAILVLIDVVVNLKNVLWRDVFASLTMAYNLLPTHQMSIVGVGWTLGVIFVFYFLFPFYVFLLFNKRRGWITLIICLLLNWCCCDYYASVGATDGVNILFLSVYFVAGGMIFLYKELIVEKIGKLPGIAVAVVSVLVPIIWFVEPSDEFSLLFTIKTIILLSVWVAAAIAHPVRLLQNRVTKYLSQISLEIYLSHMMVFRAVEKANITSWMFNKNAAYVITLLITLILTVAFSVVVKKLLSCFANIKNKGKVL